MDDTSAQLEDLLAALATLTEHNEQMLEKLQQQGVASAEQYIKQSELTNSVIEHLKQIQSKDELLTNKTIDSIQTAVDKVFAKNKADYHEKINEAFTQHISRASKALLEEVRVIQHHNQELSTNAKLARKDFEGYVNALVFNEDAYRTESAKLKKQVGSTLQEVSEGAKEQLDALAVDFTTQLSTKVSLVLAAICFSIMIFSFLIAWLFIPSKAEIAERRENYELLKQYNVADNVVKGDDGYYAEVIGSTCFKAKNGSTYCKFR